MKEDKAVIAKAKKELDKIQSKRVADKKKLKELAAMGVSGLENADNDLDDDNEGMDGENEGMEGEEMENAEGMEGDMDNAEGMEGEGADGEMEAAEGMDGEEAKEGDDE